MSKTFGQRIEELREAKDYSMRELAAKCSISAPFVSDIESGFRYPSDDVLEQLTKALGTTVEDLKSYDPRPHSKEMQELVDSLELIDVLADEQQYFDFEGEHHALVAKLQAPHDSPGDIALKILMHSPEIAWRAFDKRAQPEDRWQWPWPS